MHELLEAVGRHEGRRGPVGALLRAFERHRPGRPGNNALVAAATGLTNREQAVLELLSRRYSNSEIAARMNVGSETVKTHLQAIYRKLGVHGRREAVRAAEDSGLLAPSD